MLKLLVLVVLMLILLLKLVLAVVAMLLALMPTGLRATVKLALAPRSSWRSGSLLGLLSAWNIHIYLGTAKVVNIDLPTSKFTDIHLEDCRW